MRVARWILASGLIVAAAPLFAQIVAVGTCQPSKTSFPTIQQALNATPPGATIDVCPGPHPEQILVYQAVTLKGIASGNQGAAIITVPTGGLQQNATSLATGAAIAAQILVQGATGVTITNITVDGANNGINGCGPDPIGIYYQNSSGTISHDTILNEVLGAGLTRTARRKIRSRSDSVQPAVSRATRWDRMCGLWMCSETPETPLRASWSTHRRTWPSRAITSATLNMGLRS